MPNILAFRGLNSSYFVTCWKVLNHFALSGFEMVNLFLKIDIKFTLLMMFHFWQLNQLTWLILQILHALFTTSMDLTVNRLISLFKVWSWFTIPPKCGAMVRILIILFIAAMIQSLELEQFRSLMTTWKVFSYLYF